MKKNIYLLVLLLGLLYSSCVPPSQREYTAFKRQGKAIQLFEYYFVDSSVPPDYHRSYCIIVDTKQVSVQIYSYRDTLLRTVYPAPERALKKVRQALLDNKIRLHQQKKTLGGCAGGVGHKIVCRTKQNELLFSASRYSCGLAYSGDLQGELEPFLEDIAFLTPTLDSLIQSTK